MRTGWRMVGVAFATQLLASGFCIYSFGLFLVPLSEELGAGRAGISLAPLVMSLAGGFVAPLVGRAVTRVSIGSLMALGALSMGLAFGLLSRVDSLGQLLVVYALAMPLALNTLAGVGASALVVNWFQERRALALGVSQVGISLSGVVVAPLAAWALERWGWRETYLLFAGCSLAVAPLLWWLVVDRPERRAEDGEDPPPEVGLREGLREPNLWLIAVSGGLCFSGVTAVLNHLAAFAVDAGFTTAQGGLLISALGAGGALGKLVFGALVDRIGERLAFLLSIACQAVVLLGLPLSVDSYAWLIACVGVFGLAMGGVMPLVTALVARAFGPHRFGPMVGLLVPILIPFQMVGAPFAGWVADTRGSYTPAFLVFAGALVVAGALLVRLRLPELRS